MIKGTKPTRNVTLDADIVDLLNEARPEFAKLFHFEPTNSQLIRYVITEAVKKLKAETKEVAQ